MPCGPLSFHFNDDGAYIVIHGLLISHTGGLFDSPIVDPHRAAAVRDHILKSSSSSVDSAPPQRFGAVPASSTSPFRRTTQSSVHRPSSSPVPRTWGHRTRRGGLEHEALQWAARTSATAGEHEPASASNARQDQHDNAASTSESAAITMARAAVVQAKQKLDHYARSNSTASAMGEFEEAAAGAIRGVPPPTFRPGAVGGRSHVPKRYASVDTIFKF